MATLDKPVRQSVSLPPRVARRVKALAKTKKTSANRVVVDLIEAGLGISLGPGDFIGKENTGNAAAPVFLRTGR